MIRQVLKLLNFPKFNREYYLFYKKNYFHLDTMISELKGQNVKDNTFKETKFSFVKDETDTLKDRYGLLPFIQSKCNPNVRFEHKYINISDLTVSDEGKEVKLRARLQRTRVKGKGGFMVLRQGFHTLQGCLFVKENEVSPQMTKFVGSLPFESIVDVEGRVKTVPTEIAYCSQKTIELEITKIFLVVESAHILPFQLEDANRKVNQEEEEGEEPSLKPTVQETNSTEISEEEKKSKKKEKKEKKDEEKKAEKDRKEIVVKLATRLDNRVLDLRVPATAAIMKLQSAVGMLFREFLYKNEFVEIHTPKLQAGASEGGTNVFKFKYFDQDACLAQSPQLFKQMAIIGDLERVFEVGPVFRAENSNTPRHLCEFTGLDLEMTIKDHYFEVLDIIGDLFVYIFEGLNQRFSNELNIIANQYPFEPLKFSKNVVKLSFKEGVELLKEHGHHQDLYEDLDTENEKTLGRLVREKYDTDFYILYKYPKNARPFYTMPDPEDENFTNSYDAFIRGEEILSGAQRIHSYDLLLSKVLEKNINPDTLKDYINAFKLGAPAHGGCGIGLERVVKLFTGIRSIKRCVMFPRDPKRLNP